MEGAEGTLILRKDTEVDIGYQYFEQVIGFANVRWSTYAKKGMRWYLLTISYHMNYGRLNGPTLSWSADINKRWIAQTWIYIQNNYNQQINLFLDRRNDMTWTLDSKKFSMEKNVLAASL